MECADPLTPLVSVRGLRVEFKRRRRAVRAVDGVTLDWRRGEVLGLVGESGSGKTTLGRTLIGLESPSRGEVLVEGRQLRRIGRLERSRLLQMIFQDPYQSLDPRQKVGAQVMEGLVVHHHGSRAACIRRAVQALHDSGLQPADRVWDKYPHQLSGGQRQRVVIAAALALDPEGLICDEPVSAVDVSVKAQILALLSELRQRRGLSLLFITHDVGLAWALCDRVAVMYLGRIVEFGDTERVLLAPRHPYTRALLDAVPSADPTRPLPASLSGPAPDGLIPSGCRFHPRCPRAQERCRTDDPSLEGDTHLAACWLAAPERSGGDIAGRTARDS